MTAVRMSDIHNILKNSMKQFTAGDAACDKALSQRLAEKKLFGNEDGILSVSIAVSSDNGDIIHQSAVGLRDPLNSQEAISIDTLYNTGSISKFILMVLTLRLVQKGLFDLETTLHQLLPDSGMPNSKSITVRHLLDHSSGLRDCDFITLLENDPLTNLLKYNEDQTPDLAGLPGQQFYYANINYVLIAHALQKCMSITLQECFMRLIGDVLHLKQTVVIGQSNSNLPIAIGYKPAADLTSLIDTKDQHMFGATSFRSTPSDLVKIMAHFFNDPDFIKPQSRNLVLNSVRDVTFEVITKTNVYCWPAKMGLGIEQQDTLYGHGGWQDGHAAFLAYSPEQKRAYCCCVTKTQGLHLMKSPMQAHTMFDSTDKVSTQHSKTPLLYNALNK